MVLPRRDYLGEAPDTGTCYGRAEEEATLARWLLVDRCRLVGVLGMGGIGKTLLAARVAREAAPQFDGGALAQPAQRPAGGGVAGWGHRGLLRRRRLCPRTAFAARLALLLELLQTRRALLVLDNLETILVPGASVAALPGRVCGIR